MGIQVTPVTQEIVAYIPNFVLKVFYVKARKYFGQTHLNTRWIPCEYVYNGSAITIYTVFYQRTWLSLFML